MIGKEHPLHPTHSRIEQQPIDADQKRTGSVAVCILDRVRPTFSASRAWWTNVFVVAVMLVIPKMMNSRSSFERRILTRVSPSSTLPMSLSESSYCWVSSVLGEPCWVSRP